MSFDEKPQDALAGRPSAGWATMAAERELGSLAYKAARLADERRFIEWMDLFVDDCVYGAITHENFCSTGLYLFLDRGKRAMHERVSFLMGLWQVPRGKTLHLVTNLEIEVSGTGEAATALSNFLITRTDEIEHARLHACGQYRDRFERQAGRWLFAERVAIVDSNLLPPEFSELI